jgi:uncharacterized repeat protein (TIGR03803 family)
MGETQNQPFQRSFNPSLKVDFQGSRAEWFGCIVLGAQDAKMEFPDQLMVPYWSEAIMSSKKTATIGSLLCGVAIAALLLCVEVAASAQTWTVLHSFNGLDGSFPEAGVTRDAAGNLYGTTVGGRRGGGRVAGNLGTVYKLTHENSGWVITQLHLFTPFDGNGPGSRVIFGSDGALYGTTSSGGNGYGIVYRLQPPASCRSGNCPWTGTILHAFQGGGDGGDPSSGDLLVDQQGNIYGTAGGGAGGSCNGTCGVVYKLTRSGQSWSYSVIYTFQYEDDGDGPDGGVVQDASGNLYGTTYAGGGYRSGTVFKLTPSGGGWTESVIYNFTNSGDGANPLGGLIWENFILYGATRSGGQYGAGTVYALTPANGGWNFAVLASLPGMAGNGSFAKLATDNAGNLYGTTWEGVVFKLTHSGNNWILTQLGQGDTGMISSVIVDSNGVVFGTDPGGTDYTYGAVFEITQ